jgi:hypothetical protein
MEHKLIKIENEYYLTTEAKVMEGEYGLAFAHGGRNGFGRGWYIFYHDGRPVNKLNAICAGSRKITHSTAPIDGDEVGSCFNTIKQLSLSNCQALDRGYDLDELADEYFRSVDKNTVLWRRIDFKEGFQKALEINSDKRFTLEDMMNCWNKAGKFQDHKETLGKYIQSLQQTEWDVEIEMGDPIGIGDKYTPDTKSKLDEDGCLILKRK